MLLLIIQMGINISHRISGTRISELGFEASVQNCYRYEYIENVSHYMTYTYWLEE